MIFLILYFVVGFFITYSFSDAINDCIGTEFHTLLSKIAAKAVYLWIFTFLWPAIIILSLRS